MHILEASMETSAAKLSNNVAHEEESVGRCAKQLPQAPQQDRLGHGGLAQADGVGLPAKHARVAGDSLSWRGGAGHVEPHSHDAPTNKSCTSHDLLPSMNTRFRVCPRYVLATDGRASVRIAGRCGRARLWKKRLAVSKEVPTPRLRPRTGVYRKAGPPKLCTTPCAALNHKPHLEASSSHPGHRIFIIRLA